MSTSRRHAVKVLRCPATGTRLCACGCGREIGPGRRNWHSGVCVDAWMLRNDPSTQRRIVFERDRGICSLCGCDADAEYQRFRQAWGESWRMAERFYDRDPRTPDGRTQPDAVKERDAMAERLMSHMPNWTRGRKTGWDMDHITPVVEGGGHTGPENLRTLCHPCHKRVTAELAAKRAQQRKDAKRDSSRVQELLPILG